MPPYTWNVHAYEGMTYTTDGNTCVVRWTPSFDQEDDEAALASPIYLDDGKLSLEVGVTDDWCANHATGGNACLGDQRLFTLEVYGEDDPAIANTYDVSVTANQDATIDLTTFDGGSGTWFLDTDASTLPEGMIMADDAITGDPDQAGTLAEILVEDDFDDGSFVIDRIVIHVDAPSLQLTAQPPNGKAFRPYDATMSASDTKGPYAWSVYAGGLPPGLSLTPDGELVGIPSAAGVYAATLQVQDSIQTVEGTRQTAYKQVAIAIKPGCPDNEDSGDGP